MHLRLPMNAYQKALELDKEKEFNDQNIRITLCVCGEQFYNKGVEYYNKKLFQ